MTTSAGRLGEALFATDVGLVGLQVLYAFPIALFEGITSASLDLALPRNALMDGCKLRVQAARVDMVRAQDVAQIRSYSQGTSHELVIDFGTPRTVAGIVLPTGNGVKAVHAWLGSQFNTFSALPFSATPPSSVSFPELRSERLRVVMSASLTADELADSVALHLPEPPSGLSISIDGGAPVWSHPEPVRPNTTQDAIDETSWNKDSRRIVDLTAALAALTGDPLASDEAVNFRITLDTAVPCTLALTLEGSVQQRRVRRMRFGNETSTAVDFASEGRIDIPLPLPPPSGSAVRHVQQLRWIAEGDPGPVRIVPPVGPDAAPGDGGLPLAEALVDGEVAAITRLPAGTGIETLQALRLPLTAAGDGAEARIVLWSADESGMPSAPLPQGTSAPVTLTAAVTANPAPEAWFTFALPKPVVLDSAAAMPWAAVVVGRGALSWALARADAQPAALVDQQVLRRGPPNGPWKSLPRPLQREAEVIDARSRLRLQGLAPKDNPLAASTLALVGNAQSVDFDPQPKGAPGELNFAPAVAATTPALRLTCRVGTRVVLRDIDVVSDI